MKERAPSARDVVSFKMWMLQCTSLHMLFLSTTHVVIM